MNRFCVRHPREWRESTRIEEKDSSHLQLYSRLSSQSFQYYEISDEIAPTAQKLFGFSLLCERFFSDFIIRIDRYEAILAHTLVNTNGTKCVRCFRYVSSGNEIKYSLLVPISR